MSHPVKGIRHSLFVFFTETLNFIVFYLSKVPDTVVEKKRQSAPKRDCPFLISGIIF